MESYTKPITEEEFVKDLGIRVEKPTFEIQEVTFESDKKDWSYLFILAIGQALGVLIAHLLIVNNI